MKKHIEELNRILMELYQNEQHFVSAWVSNPRKVLRRVITKMNPVPYDVKERLEETHKHFTTQGADEYEAV